MSDDVLVTPESAGWRWSGLRVRAWAAGETRTIDTIDDELLVVPLAGSATVTVDGEPLALDGRPDVFAGPTDVAYAPPWSTVVITSGAGARLALCSARVEAQADGETATWAPARRIPASRVPVERRGMGRSARFVRNLGMPGVLGAHTLMVCEVVTPGGNWSSYPAHKHDTASPTESALEEIYYYEIARGPGGEAGFGFHRNEGSHRDRDGRGTGGVTVTEVRTGDVVLVPHGWHGPCAAAPGFDMYYLNVMAGPVREWRVTDHPDHAFVRASWSRDTPAPPATAQPPAPPTGGAAAGPAATAPEPGQDER